MAGLLFESFEFRESGYIGPQGAGMATYTSGTPIAMDRRILRVKYNDDSVLYSAENGYNTSLWLDYSQHGRWLGQTANFLEFRGYQTGHGTNVYYASGYSLDSLTLQQLNSYSIAIPQASLKTPTPVELWVTMDVRYPEVYVATLNDPANLERSEARFQIFKWGDLSLRLRAIKNPQLSPQRGDIEFGLYNGASQLGTITVVNVNQTSSNPYTTPWHWNFVKIHAKLDAVSGAFEVSIDGHNASFTGINTVSTTAAASATHLYFSPGSLGRLSNTSGPVTQGVMDNIYIDDSGFPAGRPAAVRTEIMADHPDNQWTPVGSGATTSWEALRSQDDTSSPPRANSRSVRGLGVGSRLFCNIQALSRVGTGIQPTLLGVQYVVGGLSNVNLDDAKRVRAGIRIQPIGTIFGTRTETYQPPSLPSQIYVGKEDTSWAMSNGSPYSYDSFDGTNTGAQFVLEVVDPGPT